MKPSDFKSLSCRSSLLAVSLGLLAFFLPAAAQAETLAVPAQYATIQAAVNAASNGDTVLIADGTYTGPGNVDIDFGGKNITVTSQHGAASTIINCGGYASSDGSGDHRGFYLHSGETGAIVSGLTIENGYEAPASAHVAYNPGAGIYVASNNVIIQGCVFSGNVAEDGACVYSTANSTGNLGVVTLNNCTFTQNYATNYGAGVYNLATMSLTSCIFNRNTAINDGGGICSSGFESTTTLTDCTLTQNTAVNYVGGGIVSVHTLLLTNCTLAQNIAGSSGGGIDTAGPTTLTNCVLTQNSATNYGGGINSDNSVSLTNCTLTLNSAGTGGGLYNSYAAMLTNDILYADTASSGTEIYGSGIR